MRAPSGTNRIQIKTARNILDLDKKFTGMYGSNINHMSSTARSQSIQVNDRVDKKILNIMHRLKNRFDPDTHRQKNDELVKQMRRKAALQERIDKQMRGVESSQDLNDVKVVGDYGFLKNNGNKNDYLIQVQSSGFIPEVSNESLLHNKEMEEEERRLKREQLGDARNLEKSVQQILSESQKYLPERRNIKAAEMYSKKQNYLLAESKQVGVKKNNNLSAYQAHHLQMGEAPRQKLNQMHKVPVQKQTWERALPKEANAGIRKPMTIEESINLGYRKRLDMKGLEDVIASEESLEHDIPTNQGEVLVMSQAPRLTQVNSKKALNHQREKSLKELVGIYTSKPEAAQQNSPLAGNANANQGSGTIQFTN